MDTFKTIARQSEGLYKDRGSKFIAYAARVDSLPDAQAFLATIKGQHPKARHHCYAYRIGIDGDLYRENDDGEPSGTAGKPIMGQLLSYHLTNSMVVVVRYFGGKLLGASGLIKAYRGAADDALQQAVFTTDTVKSFFTVRATYAVLNDVLPLIKQPHVMLRSEAYEEEPIFVVGVRKDDAPDWIAAVSAFHDVTITPHDE